MDTAAVYSYSNIRDTAAWATANRYNERFYHNTKDCPSGRERMLFAVTMDHMGSNPTINFFALFKLFRLFSFLSQNKSKTMDR